MWTYLKSKLTTVLGGLVVLCGGVAFTGALEQYNAVLMLICASLTGAGLIAAKDANVSNSPNPVAPAAVPPTLAAKPNPTEEQV